MSDLAHQSIEIELLKELRDQSKDNRIALKQVGDKLEEVRISMARVMENQRLNEEKNLEGRIMSLERQISEISGSRKTIAWIAGLSGAGVFIILENFIKMIIKT